MTSRRLFLLQTLGLTGITLLGVGCGGDDSYDDSQPTDNPSPIASAAPTNGAGDFGLVMPDRQVFRRFALDASGVGSYGLVLRSVQGFSKPITFPVDSVTVRSAEGGELSAAGITVRFAPETLSSLPAGDTPVTLEVQGAGALAPLSVVAVDYHAEGDGLRRYLSFNADSNNSTTLFYVPGFALDVDDFSVFTGPNAQPRSIYCGVKSAGRTGNLEIRLLDLPPNITADPLAITLTDVYDDGDDIAVRATGSVPSGLYTVRVVASLNGAIIETRTVLMTVQPREEPQSPKLTLRLLAPPILRRGQTTTLPADVTITRYTGDVLFSSGTLPPGVSVSFDPATLPLVADQAGRLNLNVTVDATAQAGDQPLELIARNGNQSHRITITFGVS